MNPTEPNCNSNSNPNPTSEPLQETSKKKRKPIKLSLPAVIFLSLLLCLGVFLSTFTVMKVRMDRAVNEQKETYQKYSKLESLFGYIQDNYVREYDEQTLWDGVYAGLFAAVGDPYTVYMNRQMFADYQSDHSGSYVGIGINVVFDPDSQGMYIYRVTPDSPAEQAGLLAGDIVTEAEGVRIDAQTYAQAVQKVGGEKGTAVSLTVLRDGVETVYSVVRDKVASQNVLYEVLEAGDKKVAYITLLTFSDETVYTQFQAALKQSEADGCTAYLFDVRNNPGGNLDVICKTLDLLLPKGILVNIVAANGATTTRESDAEHYLDAPMVVLCNGSTASAAELFTADLRDFGVAKIVGETTYGKGTMQTISPLADGSAVKLTTRYYNPMSNVSYDGIGIKPDVEVILTAEQKSRFYLLTHEEDPQLQAALALLR